MSTTVSLIVLIVVGSGLVLAIAPIIGD